MAADGPEPKVLIADRGYDANAIREAMEAQGVMPIIPARRNRKVPIPIDGNTYASGTGLNAASTS